MKTVLLMALALIFTMQSKAAMVEGSEIEKYKQAVIAYLTAAKATQCNSKRLPWRVDVLVERAQTLELSNGDQPFMTFTYRPKESPHGFDLFQVRVETSSDFSKLLRVSVQTFKLGLVNRGDFKNPIMEPGYYEDKAGAASCSVNLN